MGGVGDGVGVGVGVGVPPEQMVSSVTSSTTKLDAPLAAEIVEWPPPCASVTVLPLTGLPFASFSVTVTVDVVGARRAGARRQVLRSLDLDGVQGSNRATLRLAGLRAATYRLSLTAIDPAGNTSARKRVSLRIQAR